jgi:DNA invertase Pin-like site-specific DNA recombinase
VAERHGWQIVEVFAEFERAMIRERVLAGLKRARARGKRLGRPMIAPEKERAIRADLAAGLGFRRIMARHGVGTSVIQRIKADVAAGAEAASKQE